MASEQPRVVLQDLMLPDADGFVLVGELRRIAAAEVSILAFSGFVSKLDEARLAHLGFDDIIPKPIAASRLVPLIEAHLPLSTSTPEKFGRDRRLVIADDDPIQLKLAALRLGRLGFDVEAVSDGAAALAAIRRRPAAAVVSDVMMPELDGFGLAMAMRQDPELSSVPLVLVTSNYIEAADRTFARSAGALDLVLRTPDMAELIDTLREALSETPGDVPAPSPERLPELERERNRRVFRQLERQVMLNTGLAKRCSSLASELAVLNGIAEAVVRNRDVDAALDEALSSCFDAGGVTYGALYLVEGEALRVRSIGAEVLVKQPIATFFGREAKLRDVIRTGATLYVTPGADPGSGALLDDANARALLIVPLSDKAGPLGALMMVSRERELDEGDWRVFAQVVATQISQVLSLARAYAALEAAERKAEQHAAVLQAVVENAPDYVIQLDLEGRIGFINRVEPPLTAEAVTGTSWFEQIGPEQRAQARSVFERVIMHGKPVELELNVLRTDNKVGWYALRMGVVNNKDKVATGVVIVARDVTEKKQTEMQLMLADRMASVGTLAAGVAHELNNPLAAVIANLDMATHDLGALGAKVELPPDLLEGLQDARLGAERVRMIVRDLKIFSRGHEEHRGAVDVRKVLESTLRLAQNEIRHRAKLEQGYGEIPRVDANEGRLGQVFLNLIVNAIQAIPEGNYEQHTIKVVTALEGDRVSITVSDTGSGISPEVQRRLFTPFFTTKSAGVGLGLAIAHRIVSDFGGTLDFSTELGKGSTFRVRLPIASRRLKTFSGMTPPLEMPVRRGRILVIDDEDAIVQAISRYMARYHEVEGTTSARRALEMIERGERYDAIICDLMMPQITGMEVHAAVVKLDPRLAEKMIFVTGGAFTETAQHFLDTLPPNRHIEKPFDLKAVRALIEEKLT
jgi:PAS domain S-box-containing protein